MVYLMMAWQPNDPLPLSQTQLLGLFLKVDMRHEVMRHAICDMGVKWIVTQDMAIFLNHHMRHLNPPSPTIKGPTNLISK